MKACTECGKPAIRLDYEHLQRIVASDGGDLKLANRELTIAYEVLQSIAELPIANTPRQWRGAVLSAREGLARLGVAVHIRHSRRRT